MLIADVGRRLVKAETPYEPRRCTCSSVKNACARPKKKKKRSLNVSPRPFRPVRNVHFGLWSCATRNDPISSFSTDDDFPNRSNRFENDSSNTPEIPRSADGSPENRPKTGLRRDAFSRYHRPGRRESRSSDTPLVRTRIVAVVRISRIEFKTDISTYRCRTKITASE